VELNYEFSDLYNLISHTGSFLSRSTQESGLSHGKEEKTEKRRRRRKRPRRNPESKSDKEAIRKQ